MGYPCMSLGELERETVVGKWPHGVPVYVDLRGDMDLALCESPGILNVF